MGQQVTETTASQELAMSDQESHWEEVKASEGVDEDALFALLKGTPLLPGYKKTRKEFIFPLSVEEVWLLFFSDDSLYSINEAGEDLGDRIDSVEKWHDPKKPTSQSLPILQERLMKIRTKTPPNPFIEYYNAERH